MSPITWDQNCLKKKTIKTTIVHQIIKQCREAVLWVQETAQILSNKQNSSASFTATELKGKACR